MTIKKVIALAALFPCSGLLLGCDAGNAPKGPSPEEFRKTIEQKKPQEQIDFIKSSPMKPDEKAKKIKEIEDKYGVQDSGAQGGPPPHN